jgi:hypothetical protein
MKTLQLKKLKIGTTFLVVFLIVVIISSCEKPPQPNENRITQSDVKEMTENHIIDLKDAVKAYDKYTKQRVGILKDTLKEKYKDKDFNDTRNVWFDIKTIKAYIKYLEDNTPEVEGLQFYFSVNPDNNGKQQNQQTFFIAPTVQNVVNKDTVQSGYTIKNGKRVFVYDAVKQYLEGSNQNIQKASFLTTIQDKEGFLLNEGEDNPPGNNN